MASIFTIAGSHGFQMCLRCTPTNRLALDAMPGLETAVHDTNFQVSEAAFTTLCHLRRAYG
ncbi:MAG: hypothetical protein IPJ90_14110 [Anaerolineaceae bacterium]|nr:hypothetical protein [Anaerolineaceae bacterium]